MILPVWISENLIFLGGGVVTYISMSKDNSKAAKLPEACSG